MSDPAVRRAVDTLELRANVKIDDVVKTLAAQANEAGNASSFGAGHSIAEQLNHYLTWTEAAQGQLANVLTPLAARAQIRTDTYWVLRTAPVDSVRLTTLINDEYETQRATLNGLAEELKRQNHRWTEAVAPLVVPDSNLFLDGEEPFDSLDWASLTSRKIDVRVVIPLIVIHELDRLKRQGNSTTAKLAQNAIRWLATTLQGGDERSARVAAGEHGATFETFVHDGPSRPADADGVILELCLRLATIAGLPLTLVTKDLGMSLRAEAAGVDVVYLQKEQGHSTATRHR